MQWRSIRCEFGWKWMAIWSRYIRILFLMRFFFLLYNKISFYAKSFIILGFYLWWDSLLVVQLFSKSYLGNLWHGFGQEAFLMQNTTLSTHELVWGDILPTKLGVATRKNCSIETHYLFFLETLFRYFYNSRFNSY